MMSSVPMTDDAASDTLFAFEGHRLIVTRGTRSRRGRADPERRQLRAALPARDRGLAGPLRALQREIHAEIPLDSAWHRTGDHWHVRVDGLPEEFCYGYRVDGPKGAATATTRASSCTTRLRGPCPAAGPGAAGRPAPPQPDEHAIEAADREPRRHQSAHPLEDTIIYELHVRGLHRRSRLRRRNPGTFAGLVEKIPYLKKLGITAVELLPVDEFDEDDCPFVNPLTGEQLRNFWGYNTHRLRRPQGRPTPATPNSSRRLATSSARWSRPSTPRGSRSYLDVVFNHTAEGDERGRTYQLPRAGQRTLLHARRARPLPQLHRLRQHRQQQPSGRPQSILSCLRNWVAEGRRRRLPLRPGLGPGPRPPRQRAGRAAGRSR